MVDIIHIHVYITTFSLFFFAYITYLLSQSGYEPNFPEVFQCLVQDNCLLPTIRIILCRHNLNLRLSKENIGQKARYLNGIKV